MSDRNQPKHAGWSANFGVVRMELKKEVINVSFSLGRMSAIGIEQISALSELQPFRSAALEKTNLCFALFADFRFFVSLAERPLIR